MFKNKVIITVVFLLVLSCITTACSFEEMSSIKTHYGPEGDRMTYNNGISDLLDYAKENNSNYSFVKAKVIDVEYYLGWNKEEFHEEGYTAVKLEILDEIGTREISDFHKGDIVTVKSHSYIHYNNIPSFIEYVAKKSLLNLSVENDLNKVSTEMWKLQPDLSDVLIYERYMRPNDVVWENDAEYVLIMKKTPDNINYIAYPADHEQEQNITEKYGLHFDSDIIKIGYELWDKFQQTD